MTDITFESTVRVFSLQVALVKGIPTNDLLYTELHLMGSNVGFIFFPLNYRLKGR